MTDIVEFLRDRFDEDERAAQAAFSGQADPENGWGAERPERQRHTTITPHVGMIHEAVQADHVVRWNPARVLREVEAKRRILDEVVDEATCLDMSVDGDRRVGPRDTATEPYLGDVLLRLLALPYAEHSNYDERWRP